MLYSDHTTLLDVTDAGNAAITGPTLRMRPLSNDRVRNHEQEVIVLASGAYTSPAMDGAVQLVVESSPDGVTWFPLWTMGVAQNPFQLIGKPKLDPMGASTEPTAMFRFVRVRVELSGTTLPTVDRMKVLLASTAPLRGRRVA